MRRTVRSLFLIGGLGAMTAVPLTARQAPLIDDLVRDITRVEEKLVGLAQAIPAEKYDWRPGEGVRSVREVFMHVVAENFFLPTAVGTAPPPATGITAGDYASVQAYEGRTPAPDSVAAELRQSFAFLKTAMAETPVGKLGDSTSVFGMSFTIQQFWVLTATHLHEHLGQQIAYARTNGVVPPWSRGGM